MASEDTRNQTDQQDTDAASHSYPLTIIPQHTATYWRFCLEGDLELFTVPLARAAILPVIQQDASRPVVLDLTDVHFLDSAGLAFLLGTRRGPDGEISPSDASRQITVLVAPRSQPQRVLTLTGLSALCTVHVVSDTARE